MRDTDHTVSVRAEPGEAPCFFPEPATERRRFDALGAEGSGLAIDTPAIFTRRDSRMTEYLVWLVLAVAVSALIGAVILYAAPY